MPDFTCLDENLFAKVAQTLLQHISSTHCNFKSALGPSILLLCVRLADVQMNGFINYCENKKLYTYYAHIEEQERDSKSYRDGKDLNKHQNDCAK